MMLAPANSFPSSSLGAERAVAIQGFIFGAGLLRSARNDGKQTTGFGMTEA
jgi:hypothetical protein